MTLLEYVTEVNLPVHQHHVDTSRWTPPAPIEAICVNMLPCKQMYFAWNVYIRWHVLQRTHISYPWGFVSHSSLLRGWLHTGDATMDQMTATITDCHNYYKGHPGHHKERYYHSYLHSICVYLTSGLIYTIPPTMCAVYNVVLMQFLYRMQSIH